MAATVIITEKNGPSGTKTNKTSGTIRFKLADDAVVDNANPVGIPASGAAYSMEKVVRLEVTAAPTTQIADVVAYTDGSSDFGIGVSMLYKVTDSFVEPTIPADATGLSDLFAHASGNPISLEATNAGPFTVLGEIGDHLVLTLAVADTAEPGPLTAETLTFSYTET